MDALKSIITGATVVVVIALLGMYSTLLVATGWGVDPVRFLVGAFLGAVCIGVLYRLGTDLRRADGSEDTFIEYR